MRDKKVFISWAPYSRRSQALAAELDMDLALVHYLKFQHPAYAPFKYILQALHTLALLLKERPCIVFVQDPPIFASFVVYMYTLSTLGRAHFVVDAHTGALLHPWWKPFRGLQKFIYRRALTVITTNRTLTDSVKTWDAESMALAGPPIEITSGEARQLGNTFNLVLVNTFSPDEPLSAALEGVADTPDVHLYVTGDVSKAPSSLLERAPENVTFTGFLPDDEYLKLLRGADAVMALTTEDFTLQLGAMEAVALGKPVIISDLSFLKEYFHRGTIHVPNTSEGIRQGIIELKDNWARLSAEVPELQRAHQEEWGAKSQQLRELVSAWEIKIKLLIVLGEGGHTTELLNLVDLLGDGYNYHYVVCRDDNLSVGRIRRPGSVYKLSRPRGKQTGTFNAIFRTILTAIQSLWVLLRVWPDAIISTGPAIAVPVSILGKSLGAQIIFIETGSRVKALSLTGRIMYRRADLFFVQWPQLAERRPRAIYAGRLV